VPTEYEAFFCEATFRMSSVGWLVQFGPSESTTVLRRAIQPFVVIEIEASYYVGCFNLKELKPVATLVGLIVLFVNKKWFKSLKH